MLVHLRGDGALVAINRSEVAQDVVVPWAVPAGWTDKLNGSVPVASSGGSTNLRLQPLWGAVLAA